MIERRDVMLGLGGLGLAALGACGPAGPGSVTIAASGSAGMNPGPDGSDRPLTLTVVQMKSAGAFDGADFFALQNPSAALGGEFVKADAITLTPGAPVSKTIGLDPSTSIVGIVAGYRTPAGKTFRAKLPVAAKGSTGIAVTASSAGIRMAPA